MRPRQPVPPAAAKPVRRSPLALLVAGSTILSARLRRAGICGLSFLLAAGLLATLSTGGWWLLQTEKRWGWTDAGMADLGQLAGIEPASGEPSAADGPTERTPSILAMVAKELDDRRSELDRRQTEVAAREAALRALADEVRRDLDELVRIQKEQAATAEASDRDADERATRLARLYESMKPKRAAAVFDTFATDDLVPIARKMRDGKFAAIMQEMAPQKAKELTERLRAQ
jgi:flagellar motility protein MotE (MotC chaperone)